MSTSDFDGRNDRLDVSRYAPPQYRVPDGQATIRPVLERLSRGEPQDDSNSASAQSVPPVEPIYVQDAPPSLKIPLSMTGRLAIAMGLVAVLATVSVTFFKFRAEHPASAASADAGGAVKTSGNPDMPKVVRTVAVRPETTTVGEAQASAATTEPASSPARSGASVADRIEAIGMKQVQLRPEAALALTAPLTLWAMFPPAPTSGPGNSLAAPPNVDDVNDAAPEQTAGAPQRKAKVTTPSRHNRRRRARTTQTRSAAARPQQAIAPAQTEANAVQPTKKLPLQAALDAIFGNNADSDGGGSGAAAPATTGAAFR